jgi:hypothetical protein
MKKYLIALAALTGTILSADVTGPALDLRDEESDGGDVMDSIETTFANFKVGIEANEDDIANKLESTDIDTLAEITANRIEYYDAAVSAGATQTQAGATELADQFSYVTTAAADGDGVKFDDASNHTPGDRWYVRNDTSYTLSLYPATGDDLGEGANTATTLYPGEAAIGLFLDDDTIEVEITRNVTYTATYSSGPILAKDIAKARVIIIDTAGTYNLPAVADVPGGSCTVIVKGDISVVLNPDDADKIMLDGEDLADGDSVTNAGSKGDQFTFWDLGDGTGWGMQTNGATDTN